MAKYDIIQIEYDNNEINDYRLYKPYNHTYVLAQGNHEWMNPGSKLAFIYDDGNGYKVEVGDQLINLSYMDAEYLRILLKVVDQSSGRFRRYVRR